MTLPTTARELAFSVWMSLLGRPYIWGGDDPTGVDCSGLAILGLQAAGKLPRRGDWRAADLAHAWAPIPLARSPEPGMLLFWQRGADIGHVEIVIAVIAEKVFTIGASGGGSTTRTEADAANQNAFVKIHEAEPGWVRMVNPFA